MGAQSGFAQIAIMQAGTLNTTPVGVVVLGITQNENLQTSRHRGIRIDYLDYELPNYENLMLSAATVQGNLYMFDKLVSYRGGNCDIQIITGEGKVFKFLAASNPLGIEPKLAYSKDSRLITVDIEGAFPRDVWTSILNAATSNTAVDLGFNPVSGKDFTKQRLAYPKATESPIGTAINGSIIERTITIEPKRKAKTINNISLYDKLTATITLQIEDITLADYIIQRNKGTSPSLLFKEGNSETTYDAFSFAEGVLVQDCNINVTGEKAQMDIIYKGAFNISKMTLLSGTNNGGSAADGGISGGTLQIAA